MITYRCWAPQLETEKEARTYKAETFHEAAERFANWSYREEEFGELEVRVRRVDTGDLYEFQCEAEMVLELDVSGGIRIVGEPEAGDEDEVQP